MKHSILAFGLTVAFTLGLIACESGEPTGEAKKEEAVTKEAAKEKPASTEAAVKEETVAVEEPAMAGEETALMAPEGSAGKKENDEGVDQYGQGHHDVSEGHFRKAMEADPKMAEAHFNLALALDKLNKHGEATEHFKKAAELGSDNTKIADSAILKKHIEM